MPDRLSPPSIVRHAILPLLGLALAASAGGPRAAAAPAAQADEPVHYALGQTWVSREPRPWTVLPGWPEGNEPGGLGYDASTGWLYATDRTDDVIRAWDADRQPKGTIGVSGTGPGELRAPRDVDVLPNGRLVVADTGNNRVQVLAADGRSLRSWTVDDPQGVEVVDGAPYVVSRGLRQVMVYDETGLPTSRIDVSNQVVAPEMLSTRAPQPDGLRYLDLADPSIGRVMRIREGSTGATPIVGLEGVRTGALLPGGVPGNQYLLAGAPGAGLVLFDDRARPHAILPFDDVTDIEVTSPLRAYAAVKPDGILAFDDLGDVINLSPYSLGTLVQPRRVAAGAQVLVADAGSRVQLWSRAGEPVQDLPFDRSPDVPDPREHVPPVDVALAGDRGYVLWENGILRELRDGGFPRQVQLGGAEGWPTAVDARGDRVAVLDLVGQRVILLDADLQPSGELAIGGPGEDFNGVLDLALSDDRLYLVDRASSDLQIWSLDGSKLADVPVVAGAQRVAAGPQGRAFVLSRSGWVLLYEPDGTLRGAWPVGSASDRPTDLALDAEGRLYVADHNDVLRVYEPSQEDAGPLPTVSGDGCSLIASKAAQPQVIQLGESVEVQLVLEGSCPVSPPPADIVLAIDASGSMSGAKMIAAKDAAVSFALRSAPGSRLGVVPFASEAERALELTERRDLVVEAIGGIQSIGGTNLVGAMREADAMLRAAEPIPDRRRVIILMSDGKHTQATDPLSRLPDILRNIPPNTSIFTIGLGGGADEDLMKEIAGGEERYFYSPSEAGLEAVFAGIGGLIAGGDLFREVTLVDQLPENMTFLPGTGVPSEPDWDPAARSLTWRLQEVSSPGFRVAFRVQPTEGGVHPTNVQAAADYTDGLERTGRIVFPLPFVRVIAPTPTITPTPVATDTPTPTPTPTASATPTATSTPPPTSTRRPTPRPRRLFLPFASVDRCRPSTRSADIVLVLDSSTSMRGATREGGERKIDAAVRAAQSFVGQMSFPRDRVAAVAFNDRAEVLIGLSDRAADVRLALLNVQTNPGTRIDAGIDAARQLLTGPAARASATPVLILMTDGQPTSSSVARAISAAERARLAGITLFTIGLGADVDPELLRLLAATPGHYFFAPDAGDLEVVYRSVATVIPCR